MNARMHTHIQTCLLLHTVHIHTQTRSRRPAQIKIWRSMLSRMQKKWRGTVTGGAIINKHAYRYTYTMLYTHTHYTSIQTCPHTRKELDHWSDPSGTESQNVVLGLAASHFQKLKRFAGTSGWLFPISQSQTTVFVGQWMERDSLPPPHLMTMTIPATW